MRLVWLVPLLLLLPGCTEEDSSLTVVSERPVDAAMNNTTTEASPADVQAGPVWAELVNATATVAANTCNPSSQQHDLLFEVTILNGTTRLAADFVRKEEPEGLFATNIRAYLPGNEPEDASPEDQEAWSADGTIAFSFPDPEPGAWSFWLLHCDLPQGQHVIDAVIQAGAPDGTY